MRKMQMIVVVIVVMFLGFQLRKRESQNEKDQQ
jgi:hypothetical protein